MIRISNGWQKCHLRDLVHIKHGFAFKGEYIANSGPYVLVTPGNFFEEGGFKRNGDKQKRYSGAVPSEYILPARSLVVAMTEQAEGLLGSAAFVPDDDQYLHNQRIGLVTSENTDLGFLYYLFNTSAVRQQIRASSSGTKVRHTSPSRIGEVTAWLPTLAVQGQIVGILSAYDDMIEVNHRRIANLEDMARRLFDEWLVRFRYPGHEAVPLVQTELGKTPEGWHRKPLPNIAEITYGHPFKSVRFSEDAVGLPVVRIRDILSSRSSTFTTEEYPVKCNINDGDILIGMDGNFHMNIWANGPALLNQRVVKIAPKMGHSLYWLYLALAGPIKHLEQTIVGTTVAHLSARDLNALSILVPSSEISASAAQLLDPMASQILVLRKQNRRLQVARDLLIPKLLSGQIDVSTAEDTFAEAAE